MTLLAGIRYDNRFLFVCSPCLDIENIELKSFANSLCRLDVCPYMGYCIILSRDMSVVHY